MLHYLFNYKFHSVRQRLRLHLSSKVNRHFKYSGKMPLLYKHSEDATLSGVYWLITNFPEFNLALSEIKL